MLMNSNKLELIDPSVLLSNINTLIIMITLLFIIMELFHYMETEQMFWLMKELETKTSEKFTQLKISLLKDKQEEFLIPGM